MSQPKPSVGSAIEWCIDLLDPHSEAPGISEVDVCRRARAELAAMRAVVDQLFMDVQWGACVSSAVRRKLAALDEVRK